MNAAFATIRAQIMCATTPEGIFGDLGDDPVGQHDKGHTLFRSFAKALHPDKVPPEQRDEAGELFARINGLWQEADKRIKAGIYGTRKTAKAPVTLTTKNAVIEIGNPFPPGEIADFFQVRITETGKPPVDGILKVARHPADNDLIENEARTLKHLLKAESDADKALLPTFLPYFPSFSTSVRIDDGSGVQRAANVFRAPPKTKGYLSLETIRREFPHAIDLGHMGWMLNRIFEGLTYLHGKGVVHGAINPAHLLYNPVNHGLIFVGFGASVITGPDSFGDRKVGLVSTAYRDFTAPEILAKQEPGPAADFYGAARSMIFALTGRTDGILPPKTPKSITGFLKACLLASPRQRLHDAKTARREFQDVLEAIFGPPTYRRLEAGFPHHEKENPHG